MKRILTTLLFGYLLLTSGVAWADDLSANLISFWSLDDVNDAHSTNNLTNNGSATFAAGKVGNAVNLGGSQYLSIADNTALSVADGDVTICAWIKQESSVVAGIVTKWTNTGDQVEYGLYMSSGTQVTFLVSIDGTIGNIALVSSTTAIDPVATWFFVCGWHDATNNQIGIAVNAGTADTTAHSTGVFDGTSDFRIGAYNGADNFFLGLVDQVGVWKRVLTSGERTYLHNSGNGRAYSEIVPAKTRRFIPVIVQ